MPCINSTSTPKCLGEWHQGTQWIMSQVHGMSEWVIDRSIDWLIGWLIDWLIDWLIGCFIVWLMSISTGVPSALAVWEWQILFKGMSDVTGSATMAVRDSPRVWSYLGAYPSSHNHDNHGSEDPPIAVTCQTQPFSTSMILVEREILT